MTVTDQERKARMGERGSSTSDVQIDDPRAAHKAGQKAFKELTSPIRPLWCACSRSLCHSRPAR